MFQDPLDEAQNIVGDKANKMFDISKVPRIKRKNVEVEAEVSKKMLRTKAELSFARPGLKESNQDVVDSTLLQKSSGVGGLAQATAVTRWPTDQLVRRHAPLEKIQC